MYQESTGNEKIIQLLEEILKWTRFKGRREAKETLLSILDDDAKKTVYQLSNGRSSPKIADIVKAHPTTVRDYWKEWLVLGIVEIHPDYKKRCRRIFSLDELGIDYLKNPNPESEEERESREGEMTE